MKILLIEPAKPPVAIGGEEFHLFESLALEYIGAGVSEHHDVRLLDMRVEQDLQSVFDEFEPDIVGITAYTVHVNTVKGLCTQIKSWNPQVLTVVGGHHASVMPEDFRWPAIDLVVIGEGVCAFQEIVKRFEKQERFDGIAGVAVAREGRLVGAAAPGGMILDSLPFPDRRLTAQYRRHYHAEWMKPLASMRTSKGCVCRCNFCALWKLAGGRYLVRDPAKIVAELATIEEEYLFFADDESLVDAARMKKLAGMIKDAGIRKKYYLYGRSDTIAKNPELLERWKEIGLERVFVGFEFFRDADLEHIKKGSTTQDNENATKILQDLEIGIYASFMLRPEYNKQDFAALRRYCRQLKLDFPSFAVLTPLPGTDLYEELKEQMIVRDYDYYDFIHTLLPTTLPLKEFYREYSKLLNTAVGFKGKLGFLRKFPVTDLPATLTKGYKIIKRLGRAYRDYEKLPQITQ